MKTQGTGNASPVVIAWESLDRDPLVSPRECAQKFGVHVSTVRRWIARRRLRAVRVGGSLRLRQSQLLALLKETGGENAPLPML
jgi:excisionase family DNA binding protein